jgi:signal transduction histidine kinase
MLNYLNRLEGFLGFLDVNVADPDDARRRKNLNILVVGLAVLAIFSIVGALIAYPVTGGIPFLVGGGLIFLLFCGVVFYLNQRAKSGIGPAVLFVVALSLGLLFSDIPVEVVEGRSFGFLAVPIVVAALVINANASFVVWGFLAVSIQLIARGANLQPNLIGAITLFAIALVIWLLTRSLEAALSVSRATAEDLDRRVEDRTRELEQAYERLQELDKLKTKFVSDVSHELRTPISNITMYLEMLQHGDPADRERYFAVIAEDAGRLSKLVKDTLDLSRLEADGSAQAMERIDINRVCEAVVASNKPHATARGLNLTFYASPDLPVFWASETQVNQVVSNLVTNAINYTPRGLVQLTTYYDRQQNRVSLQVQDTGFGIEEEDLDHLFDRFYRGKRIAQSEIPGSGLGLSIVKEIVDRYGGRIDIKSEVGVGTMVTVGFSVNQPPKIDEDVESKMSESRMTI